MVQEQAFSICLFSLTVRFMGTGSVIAFFILLIFKIYLFFSFVKGDLDERVKCRADLA